MRQFTLNKTVAVILTALVTLAAAVIGWTLLNPQPTTGTTRGGSTSITNTVQSVTLEAAVGHTGAAVATRSFIDGMFLHGISADLPDVPTGSSYAGWLLKNGDSSTAVQTGTLTKDAAGYVLNFSSPTNYQEYTDVWVTLQTAASQGPQTLVLSGSFK